MRNLIKVALVLSVLVGTTTSAFMFGGGNIDKGRPVAMRTSSLGTVYSIRVLVPTTEKVVVSSPEGIANFFRANPNVRSAQIEIVEMKE